MDKQIESPYKKQRLAGPYSTTDKIPSGNNISASEDSGKALLSSPTTKPIQVTVESDNSDMVPSLWKASTQEALNLSDVPMPPGTESAVHQDRIQVLPRRPLMVLPPNATILPFSDDKWLAVSSLPRQ